MFSSLFKRHDSSNKTELIMHSLTYTPNCLEYFSRLTSEHWPVLLDSAQPKSEQGRFDILTANPRLSFVSDQHYTTISDGNNEQISERCPFAILKEYQQQMPSYKHPAPFCAGFLGYFAYDLARRLEDIPLKNETDLKMPLMAVGLYDWSLVIDHQQRTCCLYHLPFDGIDRSQHLLELLARTPDTDRQYQTSKTINSNLTQEQYTLAINKIKQHLTDGDCYQINFAQRFNTTFTGSELGLYEQLRKKNPMPFSAYLKYPFVDILSLSPERLVSVHGNQVETKPIKGTRARSNDSIQDQANAQELLQSEKDWSENVMIVDLLRNDLSKSAKAHSVKVPKLCELESFSSVHHLVSTITAELTDNKSAIDVLQDLFPGGSITGAPKVNAMKIIEALEPNRRNIFCGSIAYINHQGDMDSNITIRTIAIEDQQLYFWAGGGIVYDSTAQAEYQECFDKIKIIAEVLTDD